MQAAFETSQQASAYRFNGEMQITLSGPAVAGGMEIPARLAGGIQPPDRMQSTISACSQDRASAACQGGASASCPYGTFPPWLRYRDRLEMVRLGNLAPGNWPGICGLGTLLGVLERGHSQPVPWPGNKGMKVSNVKKVYTKEEIHQSRSCGGLGTRTTHTYKVHALTRDEQSVELVGGLKKQEQALFITQQVEKYLGI
ncbi:MAG: hypothetical protein JXM73_13325 [Anaerolineae bacterium]|nr:hypothetical protein [Anaerolineae bacterium]